MNTVLLASSGRRQYVTRSGAANDTGDKPLTPMNKLALFWIPALLLLTAVNVQMGAPANLFIAGFSGAGACFVVWRWVKWRRINAMNRQVQPRSSEHRRWDDS